jgi:hypothetical protein
MNTTTDVNDEIILQDEKRGPGWFLKLAYVVITAVCIYYLFTYWDWKSSYELQQEELQKQMQAK